MLSIPPPAITCRRFFGADPFTQQFALAGILFSKTRGLFRKRQARHDGIPGQSHGSDVNRLLRERLRRKNVSLLGSQQLSHVVNLDITKPFLLLHVRISLQIKFAT